MRVARKRTAVPPKTKPKRRKRATDKPLVSPKFEVLADGAHAVTIPVYTRPFVNGSQGTSKIGGIMRAKEKARVRDAVLPCMFGIGVSFRGVTMVRLAPPHWRKGLDTGNLWNALKGVQDEIAEHLGVDDGPTSPASWDVAQEEASAYGVRVEFRNERAKSRVEYVAMERCLTELMAYVRSLSKSAAANGNFVTSQILSNIVQELGYVLEGAV